MFGVHSHSFLNYKKLYFSKIDLLIIGQKNLNSLNFLFFVGAEKRFQINCRKLNTRKIE